MNSISENLLKVYAKIMHLYLNLYNYLLLVLFIYFIHLNDYLMIIVIF